MKQLKNSAIGLLSHFTSRNNDCGGYWALGLIVSQGLGTGIIDLLNGEGSGLLREPKLKGVVDHICRRFRKIQINPDDLVKTVIFIEVLPQAQISKRSNRLIEHSVTCKCELLGIDNRLYTANSTIWASPHDPTVDMKSIRDIEAS